MKYAKIQSNLVNAAQSNADGFYIGRFNDKIYATADGYVLYFIDKKFFLTRMFALNEREIPKIDISPIENCLPHLSIVWLEGFVNEGGRKICKIGNKWVLGEHLRNFTAPSFKTNLKEHTDGVYVYENNELVGIISAYPYLDIRIKDFEEHKYDNEPIILY